MTDPKPALTMREIRERLGHATPGVPSVAVQITEYEVSILPEGDINRPLYTINVSYRGEGRWAAVRHHACLNSKGEWSYELRPSEREDDWLAEHRFNRMTALELARKAAPQIVVNGQTATEAYQRTHPTP